MRVERLNGYISLYRDLGLEEEDSNYHSGDADDYEDEEEALSHDEVNMDVSIKHVLLPKVPSVTVTIPGFRVI